MKTFRIICLTIFFSIQIINLRAQTQVTVYSDLGANNVSDGLFVKAAGLVSYRIKNYDLETGLQVDLKSCNTKMLSGFNLKFSGRILIKDFPLEIQSFFIYTPHSDFFHETNHGLLVKVISKHFEMKAGTAFRTYTLDKKLVNEYKLKINTSIQERWNLIYSVRYYLKPVDNLWNIGIALTNLDHFIIEQETNPVINLKASYNVSSRLSFFTEAWYKTAGSFNLHVDYFGCNIKTGLIWNLN